MYIGPETMMPLASALAAVTGAVLMFWRKLASLFHAAAARLCRHRRNTASHDGGATAGPGQDKRNSGGKQPPRH